MTDVVVKNTTIKVIAGDYAFGGTLLDIYIFVPNGNSYTLVCYVKSLAKNISAKVNKSNHTIQLLDENKKNIFEIPFKSLRIP